MKSMDIGYALCLFGARPNRHKPSNCIFAEECFTWPFYLCIQSQRSDSLLNNESEEAHTEGNGIVWDFSRTTFGSSCAFLANFSCCLCKAFHYCEK